MEDKTLLGKIAAVAHEASRVFTNVFCDYNAFSPRWEECTEEVRQSIMNGVEFVLENRQTSYRDTHKNWVKFKEEHGWKFGKRFNLEKKEHPNLVGYGDLSTEEKAKDYLFKNIVLGLAEAYGLKAVVAVAAPIDPRVLELAQLVVDDKAIIVNMEGVQTALEASQRIVERLSPPEEEVKEEKNVEIDQEDATQDFKDAMQGFKKSEEGNQGIDESIGASEAFGLADEIPSEDKLEEDTFSGHPDKPSESIGKPMIALEVSEDLNKPDEKAKLSEPIDGSDPIEASRGEGLPATIEKPKKTKGKKSK